MQLFLFAFYAVSINIYHLTNLVIQSQFWASSARTFWETFRKTDTERLEQRSVSAILKECLVQLPGPNRRKPTEKRRDRTGSASLTRVGLASIAPSSVPYTFYIRQSKNRRSVVFSRAESQRNCSTSTRSLQRNDLSPPPQHNLVQVRLPPARTMDGRFAS